MAKSLMILMVATVAFQQLIACRAAELTAEAKEELGKDGESSLVATQPDEGLIPLLLLRQQSREEKPDFFLVFMKPYEQFIPKPVQDMIESQVRPQTEQISAQMISNLPGAEQAWAQLSQFQNLVNQLGVGNMVSGGGGDGSGSTSRNPLSGLMQNFGRRR